MYKRVQTTRKEQDILKRQLTQNIAHELKTPVASIQGYLETILDNPHINEATKAQFLQRCFAQSERLTSLLHDISTLNRLDDGSDMIDFEAVDITQMVADITRETALARQERKMTFDNRMPEHIVVKGNRSLIYSIFRNLTDNAIAYAGEGRKMTLEAKEQGNNGISFSRIMVREYHRSIWPVCLSDFIGWIRGVAAKWVVLASDLPL